MAEDRGWWSRADRRELERRAAEAESLAPFLELAREIRLDVARVVADDGGDVAAISELIEGYPAAERARVVREVFAHLPPDAQWAVLERVYGDDEVRRHLAAERAERVALLARTTAAREAAHAARAERRIDLSTFPAGVEVTVGLFREGDVRAALTRGGSATSCARRIVLRSTDRGGLLVLEDVFNPRGGYFVTREYDEATWRDERLPAHALVWIGSAGPRSEAAFEPVLYPGGRVDAEVDGVVREGRLHLGFVLLDDIDVFGP